MKRRTSRSRGVSRSSSSSRAAGPPLENASTRTSQPRREEASPSATRRARGRARRPMDLIVATGPGPDNGDDVWAASETDKARTRTSGSTGGFRASTSTPPPPGRCTSSRTTCGRVAAMTATADPFVRLAEDLDRHARFIGGPAQLSAHASTEHLVVVDERDGDRAAHAASPIAPRSRLRERSALRRARRCEPSARRWTPDPHAIRAYRVEVEAGPAVAHVDLDPTTCCTVGFDLCEDRDRRTAGIFRCVHQRFTGGGGTGGEAPPSCASPTATTSTRAPWRSSTSAAAAARLRRTCPARPGRRPLDRAGRRARHAVRAPGSRQSGDVARIGTLNQRQRVQDRVMHVRRDLGELLRADALGTLSVQIAQRPQQMRQRDQHPAGEEDESRDDRTGLRGQRRAVVQQPHQRPADRPARRQRSRPASTVRRGPPSAARAAAHPSNTQSRAAAAPARPPPRPAVSGPKLIRPELGPSSAVTSATPRRPASAEGAGHPAARSLTMPAMVTRHDGAAIGVHPERALGVGAGAPVCIGTRSRQSTLKTPAAPPAARCTAARRAGRSGPVASPGSRCGVPRRRGSPRRGSLR